LDLPDFIKLRVDVMNAQYEPNHCHKEQQREETTYGAPNYWGNFDTAVAGAVAGLNLLI
jgi:hypothetical protein